MNGIYGVKTQQLELMRSLAERAMHNGVGDSCSSYRGHCYCPVQKPTKFIVTLKPMMKTTRDDQQFMSIQDSCCCNNKRDPQLERGTQVNNSNATLKGKTVLNAFRVLTNSKFISIDPKYNYGKDIILSTSRNKIRLTGGGGGGGGGRKKGSENRPSYKERCKQHHSSRDASTSQSNVRITPPPKPPRAHRATSPIPMQDPECPCATPSCEGAMPRAAEPYLLQHGLPPKPPGKLPRAGGIIQRRIEPTNEAQALPSPGEPKPTPKPRSNILSLLPFPLPCPPILSEQLAPTALDPKTSQTKCTEEKSNAAAESVHCNRIAWLEEQVRKLRQQLAQMQSNSMPQEEGFRFSTLTKKLKELMSLLGELKNTAATPAATPVVAPAAAPPAPPAASPAAPLPVGPPPPKPPRLFRNTAAQAQIFDCRDQPSQTPAARLPVLTECGTQSTPASTAATTPRASRTSVSFADKQQQSTPVPSTLSQCPICQRLEALGCIVKSNLRREILQRIGSCDPCDIVLSVLLQTDCIYHINIAVTSTGQPLNCFYATEEAINVAVAENMFNEFLTFFIVDASMSAQQKDKILAHTFEFFKC